MTGVSTYSEGLKKIGSRWKQTRSLGVNAGRQVRRWNAVVLQMVCGKFSIARKNLMLLLTVATTSNKSNLIKCEEIQNHTMNGIGSTSMMSMEKSGNKLSGNQKLNSQRYGQRSYTIWSLSRVKTHQVSKKLGKKE